MSPLADRTIAALRTNHDELAGHVRRLEDDDLARPSGATEWDVAQVLSHLGSGAEIALAGLEAAANGSDAPGQDFNESVWDRWNAKSRREQADDFLDADARLVAAFERLDQDTRDSLEIKLGFLPQPLDAAAFSGMRLSEAVFHSWDVRVAFDPAAALPTEEAKVLLDQLTGPLAFMIGFFGKSEALGDTEAAVRIEPSDSDGAVGLTLGSSIALTQAPVTADAAITGPTEAILRLFAGRLRPEHTPATVEVAGNAITLDQLRQVFPGI